MIGCTKRFLLLFSLIPNIGCTTHRKEISPPACTDAWYTKAEKKLLASDGQRHGPDLGSLEWRSAVDFRLGIDRDPNLPPLDSDAWCRYIDRYFM